MQEIEDNGVSPASSVSHCCVKETYSNQYQWRYYTGNTDNIGKVIPKIRPVYQFDLQGNYITYYKCIKDACTATQLKPRDISNVCTGHQSQAGGYYWNYKKRFDYKEPSKKIAVACYKNNGEFIKSFTSLKEAAAEYNVHYSAITSCIKGKQKRCAGVR